VNPLEVTMDDLDFLQAHVPEFAGYADEENRHQTDRRVRAVVGSTLAEVLARLGDRLDAANSDALEALIFRCEFPDQKYVTEMDHAQVNEQTLKQLGRIDRALVELAESARGAGPTEMPAIVAEIDAQLDRRDAPLAA
jgi:hypothetical protein